MKRYNDAPTWTEKSCFVHKYFGTVIRSVCESDAVLTARANLWSDSEADDENFRACLIARRSVKMLRALSRNTFVPRAGNETEGLRVGKRAVARPDARRVEAGGVSVAPWCTGDDGDDVLRFAVVRVCTTCSCSGSYRPISLFVLYAMASPWPFVLIACENYANNEWRVEGLLLSDRGQDDCTDLCVHDLSTTQLTSNRFSS